MPGADMTCGYRFALAPRTAARACANCASAIFSVWLETSMRGSSVASTGSPNRSHHTPRASASRGCAGFQFSVSLNAGTTAGGGGAYRGLGAHATVHTAVHTTVDATATKTAPRTVTGGRPRPEQASPRAPYRLSTANRADC